MLDMNAQLKGKNAVITGAASGIGLESPWSLGTAGARVVLLDRDEAEVEAQAARLQEVGVDALWFAIDVAEEFSVNQAFEQVSKALSNRIDILVNSAGIAEVGSVEETTTMQWQKILSVNVTGSFLCARATLGMMKAYGGKIINIASVAGKVGIPRMAAYCTSKAAIIGLTRQMAADYSSMDIGVNCICPGTVAETGMGQTVLNEDATSEARNQRLSKYPIGRFASVSEIASAVLFLASHSSSFLCGSELVVDGGMTAI
uniref:(S)-2-Hydroxypropyl-CoM dehydrogenase (S-HPCDH) n=1 Tax=Alteromonadaceae bacterium PE-TB08W TaxID=1199097 RepID=A0A3G9EIU8_9ALTE|nr:(S)-2-Hydroxypropyl-CoM dehydrogenase (S-HPCDH) [Alteromonadaceae bacterium PE-TB08W]